MSTINLSSPEATFPPQNHSNNGVPQEQYPANVHLFELRQRMNARNEAIAAALRGEGVPVQHSQWPDAQTFNQHHFTTIHDDEEDGSSTEEDYTESDDDIADLQEEVIRIQDDDGPEDLEFTEDEDAEANDCRNSGSRDPRHQRQRFHPRMSRGIQHQHHRTGMDAAAQQQETEAMMKEVANMLHFFQNSGSFEVDGAPMPQIIEDEAPRNAGTREERVHNANSDTKAIRIPSLSEEDSNKLYQRVIATQKAGQAVLDQARIFGPGFSAEIEQEQFLVLQATAHRQNIMREEAVLNSRVEETRMQHAEIQRLGSVEDTYRQLLESCTAAQPLLQQYYDREKLIEQKDQEVKRQEELLRQKLHMIEMKKTKIDEQAAWIESEKQKLKDTKPELNRQVRESEKEQQKLTKERNLLEQRRERCHEWQRILTAGQAEVEKAEQQVQEGMAQLARRAERLAKLPKLKKEELLF